MRDMGAPTTADTMGLYHYTTRTDNLKESAGALDLGFHYASLVSGLPVDTDGDGCPDGLEDRNGNGVVDPGEMRPDSHDENDNGIFDGEEIAAPPEVIPVSYTLRVERDLFTPARSRDLPDSEIGMGWEENAGGQLCINGHYSECETPPTDPTHYMNSVELYTWDSVEPPAGTAWTWNELAGWCYNGDVQRPPSDFIAVPWERCPSYLYTMVSPPWDPPFAGTYLREADTRVNVYSGGPEWPKKRRAVVIFLNAVNKTSGSSLDPSATGARLGEPVDEWGEVNWCVEPTMTPMFVAGKRVDANQMVYLQLPKDTRTDVTPSIASVNWFQYDMFACLPMTARMTWTRHPGVTIGDSEVQDAFDAGAEVLAQDTDDLIGDWDPRVNPGDPSYNETTYLTDDVPVYMEFLVPKAWRAQFPNGYSGVDYTHERYNSIEDLTDLHGLRLAPFSNIKVVSVVMTGGSRRLAAARPTSRRLSVGSNHPK
jgi:hypothetical protein